MVQNNNTFWQLLACKRTLIQLEYLVSGHQTNRIAYHEHLFLRSTKSLIQMAKATIYDMVGLSHQGLCTSKLCGQTDRTHDTHRWLSMSHEVWMRDIVKSLNMKHSMSIILYWDSSIFGLELKMNDKYIRPVPMSGLERLFSINRTLSSLLWIKIWLNIKDTVSSHFIQRYDFCVVKDMSCC